MKNYKSICLITLCLVITVFSVSISNIAKANINEDPDFCVVDNESNTKSNGYYPDSSLGAYLEAYNYGSEEGENASYRMCKEEIKLDTQSSKIYIKHTMKFKYRDTENPFTFDGNDHTIVSEITKSTDNAIFEIVGSKNVIFKSMTIDGNANPFVKCKRNDENELGTTVTLEHIHIHNSPNQAIIIEGCQDVKLTDIHIIGSTTNSSDDTTEDIPLIIVKDATGVTLNTINLSQIYFENRASGVGVKVENANNVSLTDIFGSAGFDGTLVYLKDIDGLTSLTVDGSSLKSGVRLTNVLNGTNDIDINISGNGISSSGGSGLYIDGSTYDLAFSNLEINNFGKSGIYITGTAHNNNFYTVTSHTNGGYGVYLGTSTHENEIYDGVFHNNVDCGINIGQKGKNKLTGTTNTYNNGCAITGENLTVSTAAISILPKAETELYINADKEQFSTDAVAELHYKTGSVMTTTSGGNASSGTVSRKFKKVNISGILTNPVSTSSTGSTGGEDGVLRDSSYITRYSINTLPQTNTDIDSVYSGFFFIVKSQQGYVNGVWNGSLTTSGNIEEGLCYQDPNSTSKMRLLDLDLDSDEDGLKDYEEDINLNCVVDEGETDPIDPDSFDDDDVNDYCEQMLGTSVYKSDTDDDGLTDYEEDANHNCKQDDNETDPTEGGEDTDGDGLLDGKEATYGTNPHNPDSDGDDIKDGEDACPMVKGDCYYDYCIEGVNTGEDFDGDGIDDYKEDANHNCEYDVGELRADNTDTDGDGITDDKEDRNRNGQYDDGETDGTNSDTDGDCIPDGLEDKNHDGEFSLSSYETDPTEPDSDLDGVNDGGENGEDLNCNGEVDEGETKPYLIDTDGDGMNDGVDVCPWNTEANCVVRYCNLNVNGNYDADGDGLTDKEEDFDGDCAWTESGQEPHPLIADTDEDGLSDSIEVDCFGTNPVAADSDGDGRTDYEEVENSISQCQPMYNLGDTDPLRAEFGCALNPKNNATNAGNMPIILLSVFGLMVVFRLRKQEVK